MVPILQMVYAYNVKHYTVFPNEFFTFNMTYGFTAHASRVSVMLFTTIRKVGPFLCETSQTSKMFNIINCRSLTRKFTQIGK